MARRKATVRTRPTRASVSGHIAAVGDEAQRKDCKALIAMMRKVTGHTPRMWGPSIVGFGSYHYRYDSGREGDMCVTGFAVRKNELVVYLIAEGSDQEALLARLGKHRMTKSCLYLRRLSDVDVDVLGRLVANSIAEVRRRYG